MFDISSLKEPLEEAIEEMLCAADRCISWHNSDPAMSHQGEASRHSYQQLPGLYEAGISDRNSDVLDALQDPSLGSRYRLLLHEDNTFEYTWKLLRHGKAPMEYILEITGDWSKAVFSRDLLGIEDQHLALNARRLRFKRFSDYDSENKSWRITLKSLTRDGSDWVFTDDLDKGYRIPAFALSFLYKDDGSLVLAGLTKRLGNKLVEAQKRRLQQEKNSWRFGLNYLFETLKQHKEWYSRNQQYVQLNKDLKRAEAHVTSIRSLLSESVCKLELEAGLREAELEGRVGAYKIIFEVTRIISKLSRPLVKLQVLHSNLHSIIILSSVYRKQILKPNDSSISIYCDTFVIDIALSQGEGLLNSASLTTVQKDQFKQYPKRDEELMHSLKLLAAGDSTDFMEKVERLINRAELAVKHPEINLEQLEEDAFSKLSQISMNQYWDVKRAVDGIQLCFRDPFYCSAVFERSKKRTRVENMSNDPHSTNSSSAESNDGRANPAESNGASTSSPQSALDHGEWNCTISFIEWNGKVAFYFVGDRPLVMVGVQARRLANEALGSFTENENNSLDEKAYNELINWTNPNGTKAVVPRLYFSGDTSQCFVCPTTSDVTMRQDFLLTTKEISDGLQVDSFPVLLTSATEAKLASILGILSQNLFFHSVILSMFGSPNNLFGHRVSQMNDGVIRAMFKVDVQAPKQFTLKTSNFFDSEKEVLIDFHLKPDMTIDTKIKFHESANSPKASEMPADQTGFAPKEQQCPPDLKDLNAILQKMALVCHSVPLLMYHAMVKGLEARSKEPTGSTLLERESLMEEMQETVTPRTLATEEFQDMELSTSIKLEGAILDDMMY
uniref:Uncharacterized protein AlNc14C113G6453 n=1 Tax=Albugo laibachii Nc14 TaxID=890382 RepID=F0WIR8_9STRA|nr:conserved hypothetical protein [Albugo laibachii Nc14]|eukprot:CCA21162.1 conserved hypothetical protein [Albugo laibachii Nc14]